MEPGVGLAAVGRRSVLLIGAAFLLVLPLGVAASGGHGSLDLSFGRGGIVTTLIGIDPGATASALVVQPDGKLVVAGGTSKGGFDYYALARYNVDGSLDRSFGSGGIVTTPWWRQPADPQLAYPSAAALVIQRDGKLVAAGDSNNGSVSFFTLVRYRANGSLDRRFGRAGTVTGPRGGADALVRQPDGKLVAGGGSLIVRYNAEGSRDRSYGLGGTTTTGGDIHALALEPNGKLVAGGSSRPSNSTFYLVRYDTNGSLDRTFGSNGTVKTPIGQSAEADALVVQPDGKLVAAGTSRNGRIGYLTLARYNANGSLDRSFASGGRIQTRIGYQSRAFALALQPDGKLVAAGESVGLHHNGSLSYLTLVRYLQNGSLDPSFGSDGTVTTALGAVGLHATALVILHDGKLVSAGYSDDGSTLRFALARFLG
jgi:uncharacterized delta-60 repeat protein